MVTWDVSVQNIGTRKIRKTDQTVEGIERDQDLSPRSREVPHIAFLAYQLKRAEYQVKMGRCPTFSGTWESWEPPPTARRHNA